MNTHDAGPQPALSVGMVLFPQFNQLDLAGPYEVFSRFPGARIKLLAATVEPVRTEWGMTITPDSTFDDSDSIDLLYVPGGWGVNEQLENPALLEFLRDRADQAGYITSVCSGSLLLGAAGLLRGYRATTHWMSLELLALLGAEPMQQRVVVDRNRITGGGVTAGIDFGLTIAGQLYGDSVAQEIQLAIEYLPSPPYESGHPTSAPDDVTKRFLQRSAPSMEARRLAVQRAASRLTSSLSNPADDSRQRENET
jgi:cyclohexyl-isocyanide hydratase